MQTSLRIPLQRDPEKVRTVQSYWTRMILKLTDLDLMIYNNLSSADRAMIDMQRMNLRRVIARCSRLKTSITQNIIFQ